MKKGFQFKALLAFLCLFILSCNDKKIILPNENISQIESITNQLTIETAKNWFNKNVKQKANGKISSTKIPLWEYATQYTEKSGVTFVLAPVLVEEKDQRFAVILKESNKNLENKDFLPHKNY